MSHSHLKTIYTYSIYNYEYALQKNCSDKEIVNFSENGPIFTLMFFLSQTDEPRQFLIEMLEKLKKARTTRLDYPCLFDDTNVQSVFGMLDPTGRGFITLQQYKEGIIIHL